MLKILLIFAIILCALPAASAQVSAAAPPANGSMAVSPARFELEMKPGTETTVVVNLDYRSPAGEAAVPARIMATLSDWNMTKDGRVEYYRPDSRPDSASSWLIYSPGEAAVMPGTVHQIRVTVSVPSNAAPGDHLTALLIEQRPENIKYGENTRQMIVRYRMASVFYIKVPNLTQKGLLEDLYAESKPGGILVTPTLKNDGNSVVRPVASVKVLDAEGKEVAAAPDIESLPVLAGAHLVQPVTIGKPLAPGNYTVKYRIDFQDGEKAIEGITDFSVTAPGAERIALVAKDPKKP